MLHFASLQTQVQMHINTQRKKKEVSRQDKHRWKIACQLHANAHKTVHQMHANMHDKNAQQTCSFWCELALKKIERKEKQLIQIKKKIKLQYLVIKKYKIIYCISKYSFNNLKKIIITTMINEHSFSCYQRLNVFHLSQLIGLFQTEAIYCIHYFIYNTNSLNQTKDRLFNLVNIRVFNMAKQFV